MNKDTKIKNLTARIIQLEKEHNTKNKKLDAMWWVWCSGGCDGGTSRFQDAPRELTKEMVEEAEWNTTRLRQWFENKQFKNKWKTMSEEEREIWFKDKRKIT